MKLNSVSRSRFFSYSFAIGVTALTLAFRLAITPWVNDRPFLVLFFIPIIISAYIGGLGPGLVATFIAAIGSEYYLLPPVNSFAFAKPMDFLQWLVLVISGVLASGLNEALHRARQRAALSDMQQKVTLRSIGDAVITTDADGKITLLNEEAEKLTGWTNADATGQPLPTVFRIYNEQTGEAVENPVEKVFRTGGVVGLANHTVLIARDGREIIIDDSGAPIRNPSGNIIGVVLVFRDNTEKKRAEDKLRRQELFLEETGRIAGVGGWEFDPITGNGNWTDEVARIHDLSPDVAPSREFGLSFYTPESRPKIAAAVQAAIEYGTPYDLELEIISATGVRKWVRTICQPVVEKGKVVRVCGAIQDITGQKRLQSEKNKQSEHLQQVIEQTRCIVSSGRVKGPGGWRENALNAESPFLWDFPVINPEAAQEILLLEVQAGEAYNAAWKRSRHPEDHQQMNRDAGAAFLGGHPFYRSEFRCKDKHGRMRWLQQHVTVESLSEDEWLVFGVTTDITELKTTQELYQVLFDASPAGFLRQDETGKIIDANKAVCQMTGYSRQELIGQSVEIFAAPQVAELVREHLNKILQGGVHVHEVENKTKSGQSIFVKIVETCIRFPDGHREILCNVTNITERKQADLLLETQKQILEMVANGRPQTEIFEALCSHVEAQNPGLQASLLLMDRDQKHLRHGAAPTLPEPYCRMIDGIEIGAEVGSCGTAAFTKKPVIVEDIATSPLWKNFAVLGAKYGLRSCWSSPVLDAQKNVLGTFAIYSLEKAKPTPSQMRLMEMVTHIAALVITKQRENQQLTRLAAIVESSDDAIISKTLNGIITSWNRGAELIFGYTAEEVIGRSLLMLFPPDREHEEEEILKRISAGQNVVHFETVRVRKDGQRIDVSMTISPLKNENGEIIGASKVARDITARKKADATVATERARFKLIFENAPVGIAFHCQYPDGSVSRDINRAHLKIAGISREQHDTPEIYRKITHPDDVLLQDQLTRQVSEGKINQYSLEKRYLHADGKIVWVNYVYQREIYADGTAEVLTTVVDITALKEALDKIAREQSRFKLIFDSIPVGVAFHTVQPDGTIARNVNEAHLKICGISREQSNDTSIYSQITHPDDRVIQQKLMAEAHAKQLSHFTTQKRYLRPDQSIAWVNLNFQSMVYPDGTIEELTTIADITEHKRLEDQLRQSQKMEAIGQLSGGIAHDFNNILTAILGNATLLSDPEITHAEAQECLQEIVRAARRAADLTRQLLLFSRKQTMQPALVDLNQIVSRSTKMLQRILGEDITLRTEFDQGLPAVSADGGMIEQSILNLAVNARDAMPGGGQLKVRTAIENIANPDAPENTQPTPHACLTISDNGSGISPEILPHIFEPFFTTKEVGKGTGLGLATVYGIIKQHNGWITVTSEPGQGTEFKIYLPAISDRAVPLPTVSAVSHLPRGTGTILVVEDEPPVRSLVCHLLHRLGYQVIEAVNGNEALELWRINRSQISLLLTDVIMPGGMTGTQLAAKILAEAPETKIIFNSGYTGTPTEDTVPLIEGRNFIRKPFSPDALADLIHRTLNEKKSDASA